MSTESFSNDINKVLPTGEDLGGASTGGDLEGAKATFAAIFDMDGTLIDNTPFHFLAWALLFKEHGLPELSRETYKGEISGIPIANTVRRYFADADEATIASIAHQKQMFYQREFLPYLKAISGLEDFLAELKNAGVKMAVATSSDMADVDFIFDAVPIGQYFDAIITGDMVQEPKPSPLIFLKAAELLDTPPARCVVFEDSAAGLQAGNSAGMKVVGITTSHPAEKINQVASLAINNYAGIHLHMLAALFDHEHE
ncbi:HAD family hydrolase [Mucilaginibacter psychrotolerans]|uniref:HAD family phosphatase n=1 Tax=Mucilaginibacter psychrotolerans TaxID=1524096 RepID=A0A4Y8SGM9_9SPHI|nr:HAD family phosphatase [Mucilaginibacter psychrotolerans]TFF37566.1 HAD family phosphatase [Mucilaginibacter psychrotolerans]